MTRVVSITPVPVERDSRTFKHAASLARLGYESSPRGGAERPGRGAPVRARQRHPPAGRGARPGGIPVRGRRRAPRLGGAAGRPPRSRPADHPRRAAALEPAHAPRPAAGRPLLPPLLQPVPGRLTEGETGRALRIRRPRLLLRGDSSPEAAGIGRLSGRLLGAIERACVRRAAGLTTVSEGVADLMEARFGRRPEVIRNCPDLRLDRPSASDVRSRIGAPEGTFVMVSVGNAKVGTRSRRPCSRWSSCRSDVHLAFVGGGYERHRERARELAPRREGSTSWRPCRPPRSRPSSAPPTPRPILYRAFTPNFHNRPAKPLLPRGRGRAAADLPAPAEITALAERYRLGVAADPTDPASVAAAVRALRDDPSAAEGYRENVRTAREELSWEREEALIGSWSPTPSPSGRRTAEMCGLAGIVSRDGVDPARAAVRWRTRSPIAGPTARGYLLHRAEDARFGARPRKPRGGWNARIGRVRPSPPVDHRPARDSDQPLVDAAGELALVYNGEIYNYVELRAGARGPGHDVPHDRRHRGRSSPPTRSGARLRRALGRHVGLRDPRRARAASCSCRATASGSSRCTGRVARRRAALRLGDQGAARRAGAAPEPERGGRAPLPAHGRRDESERDVLRRRSAACRPRTTR